MHRIGKDKFDECLNYIGASENFIRAAKSPRVSLLDNYTHTVIHYMFYPIDFSR